MALNAICNLRVILAVVACLLVAALVASCSSKPVGPDTDDALQARIVRAYESRKSSSETITEAAWALRRGNMPASFWATVANSSRRGYVRQRTAVLVLFADYLRKGMTLAELARMMGNNKWLGPGQVKKCAGIVGGRWPVGLGPPHPTYMVLLGHNWPGQPTLANYEPTNDRERRGVFGALPWKGTLCNRRPDAVLLATTGRRFPAAVVAAAMRGERCAAAGARVVALGFIMDNCHDAILIANDNRRLLPHEPSVGFGGRVINGGNGGAGP